MRRSRGRSVATCGAIFLAARVAAGACPPALAAPSTEAVPLTRSPANERDGVWSPDGGAILYESDAAGNWDLYVMAAEGGAVERLTADAASDRHPAWSPNGERIAFASDRGGRFALYLLDPARRTVTLVHQEPDGDALYPDWSPDGARLAFTMRLGERHELRTLRLADGAVETPPGGSARDLWPRWSPDGTALLFFSRRAPHPDDDELYLALQEGPRRLTNRGGHDYTPAWSPDGDRIVAAVNEADGPAIAVFDRSGALLSTLGRGFAGVTAPRWSPDGGRILFAARAVGEGYDLYVAVAP